MNELVGKLLNGDIVELYVDDVKQLEELEAMLNVQAEEEGRWNVYGKRKTIRTKI